jgi:DNA-binding response OmpR family regulator
LGQPKRILLIDHEPRLTAALSSALAAEGRYLIRQERYSPQALKAALEFRPNLILLEAEPGHLEIDLVAQRIHSEQTLHDVPVVCLTSLSPKGEIGTVGFLGGYTFMANPFYLEDMVSWIGEILRRKRVRASAG